MSGAFFLNLFCFVWYIWSMCGFCDRYLQGRRIKKNNVCKCDFAGTVCSMVE